MNYVYILIAIVIIGLGAWWYMGQSSTESVMMEDGTMMAGEEMDDSMIGGDAMMDAGAGVDVKVQ